MGNNVPVKIKRLIEGVRLPEYATDGSAGMDIFSPCMKALPPGGFAKIDCGFAVEIPNGYEIQVRPRSGLASMGVTVSNSPGTIDSDYRGEVGVLLVNHSDKDVIIQQGSRIAQMVIAPVYRIDWFEADELSDTIRGSGGFGSTGK